MEAKKGRRKMKKFELTTEFITNAFGKKLFRIKALVEFGDVKAGELGGYVEKEENVSQDGDAWVSGNAEVSGDAEVRDNADYTLVQGFGTKFRCTTFYRGKNKKIMVNCGCFRGDLEGFRKQVKETRSGKIAKEYLMIADLMEYHFTSEDSSDE
jgi:hypothetical protein